MTSNDEKYAWWHQGRGRTINLLYVAITQPHNGVCVQRSEGCTISAFPIEDTWRAASYCTAYLAVSNTKIDTTARLYHKPTQPYIDPLTFAMYMQGLLGKKDTCSTSHVE